jgi:hypothetical protein
MMMKKRFVTLLMAREWEMDIAVLSRHLPSPRQNSALRMVEMDTFNS